MSKDRSVEPKKKKDTNQIMITISLMIVVILFVADLYTILSRPGKYAALAGITLLLLIWVYLFINAVLRELNKHAEHSPEQELPKEDKKTEEWQLNQVKYFTELIKSEKASYLLLKKVFEQISRLEGNSELPAEDVIAAQKAIAKVTISRNKENTDAIMNSNDKVMDRMFAFEEKMDENNQQLLEDQREILDASARGIMEGQQGLEAGVMGLEKSIQNELIKVSGAIDSLYQKMVTYTSETTEEVMKLREEMESYMSSGNMPVREISQMDSMSDLDQIEMPDSEMAIGEMAFVDEDLMIGEMALTDEEPLLEELSALNEDIEMGSLDLLEEAELEDLPLLEEEAELEDLPLLEEEAELEDLPLLEEEAELEDLPLLGEESILDDLPLLEEELSIDDLLEEESEMLLEPELENLPLLEEEPGLDGLLGLGEELDDLLPEEKLESEDLPMLEEEPELGKLSALVEEPQAEEPNKAPVAEIDTSNPNKMLTPEEIAALVAGAAENNPEPQPVTKEVPEIKQKPEEKKPEPAKKEKSAAPAMPDLSNPNKLMTPEEIAALIANM